MALTISSPAFGEDEAIPSEYTCEGRDISPQLRWKDIPGEANSLSLIVDDPDAPGDTFTHWIIFNIPSGSSGLSQAIPSTPQLYDGSVQGGNDFGRIGYGGPCPPPGKPHTYRFSLYAIDKQIDLVAGSSRFEVLDAIKDHILAQAQLSGTYQR
jgi:Raf kinase inhibitor-like YbhB/YbcL family protein